MFYYEIEAKILPDRNFISDLIYNYEEHWVKITALEFESIEINSKS